MTRNANLLVTLLALGLLGPSAAHAQGAPGIKKDEIVLGGVFALSGPFRLATEPYEHAIRAYFNVVNEAGGINGRKITYIVEDDAYQPARAVAAAKKLVERDDVFMLFGAVGTPTAQAIAPYAETRKVPFMTMAPRPRPYNRYAYGLTATFDNPGYILTRHFLKREMCKKVGFFYQNDEVGANARPGVDRAVAEASASLAADVGYERGTTDFGTYVLRLRDAQVDCVVAIGSPPTVAGAIKAADTAGYKAAWGTYGPGVSNNMLVMLGDKIDGLRVASEVETQPKDSPAAAEHVEQIKKYYKDTKPDFLSFLGYAQARLIVDILKELGPNPTREALIALLTKDKDREVGVMAPLNYSGDGNPVHAMRMYQWRGPKLEMLADWQTF